MFSKLRFFTAIILISLLTAALIFVMGKPKVSIPPSHTEYIINSLPTYKNQCDNQFGVDAVNEQTKRIKIHSAGTMASVFQFSLQCDGVGSMMSATGSVYTLILVKNQVYEAWLYGVPFAQKINGTVLILPVDDTQCKALNSSEMVEIKQTCIDTAIWNEEYDLFYGHGTALSFLREL